MRLEQELAVLEKEIDTPKALSDVLIELGLECYTTENCVYIRCPACKGEKLYIHVTDNTEEFFKWRCYQCEAHMQDKVYDNLIGLLRLADPKLSPFQALNKLADIISKPKGKCDILLTFGMHKGKRVDETPVSYLKWLIEKSTLLSNKMRIGIENYLVGL